MQAYVLLGLWLWTALCAATSLGRTKPLSFVSEVSSISVDTPDGLIPHDAHELSFSINIEIPSSRQFDHRRRRWWAVTDPNNFDSLTKFGAATADESESLFRYLTRNTSSIEKPEDNQVYKIILEPSHVERHHQNIKVWTSNEHGQMVLHPDFEHENEHTPTSYMGNAYRRVAEYHVSDGSVKYRYRKVGWARMRLHQAENGELKVHGAWKVDDWSGLGVKPAVYHLDYLNHLRRTLNHDELSLLDAINTTSVVWRDVDMREHQDSTYTIPDDDYDDLLDTATLTKRQSGGSGSSNDNGDNDTQGNGFSSGTNLANTIGDSQGCPTHREVALIGIAADCNFLKGFNNTSDAREHIINTINTASQQYETSFNLTLGLSAIFMVNNTDCPAAPDNSSDISWNYACSGSSSPMGDRLSRFSKWRGERSDDGLATWSMMTTCNQGGIIGLSWLGMVCGSSASQSGNDTFVAGTNVVATTSLDWRVVAHEIGHSFGAVHDCTSDTCAQGLNKNSQCCPFSESTCNAGGLFIMNPSSTDSQDGFSNCTVGNICQAMFRSSVNSTCLTSNTGVHLVTKNECGNGIVEEGEECDCGGVEGCKGNTCCDPTTCKFTAGSQCDDANEVCCSSCRFSSSDTVCRASQGPCDPAEHCTGNSSACPADVHTPDGDKCTDPQQPSQKGLTCISGHCTSRNLQCVTLLGNTTLQVNGETLNVTGACFDDSSCQLSCFDPSFDNECFTTSQNFLDGTPCNSNGQCQRGVCIGGTQHVPFSGDPQLPPWLNSHKGVIIGIACAIGGLILIACLYGFIKRAWMQRRVIRQHKRNMASASPASGYKPQTVPAPIVPPTPQPPAYTYWPQQPAQGYQPQNYYEMQTFGQHNQS